MEGLWEYKDFCAEYKEFDNWNLEHKHNSFEIFLLVKGEMEIVRMSKKYHMKPGYVFMCAPNFLHSYSGNGVYSRYSIIFSQKFMEAYFTHGFYRNLTKCFTSEVIRLNSEEQKRFIDLYDMMLKNRAEGGPYPLYLANIMDMLDKAAERQENNIIPEHVDKETAAVVNVIMYINSNYRTIRSIDEIAQACFISKSYLCHIFKKEYDMTVMEYLKSVKIRHACEFLATSDKTFTLISTKLGFADISHFTKNFKKIMGCTPREYRDAKKKEREQQGIENNNE